MRRFPLVPYGRMGNVSPEGPDVTRLRHRPVLCVGIERFSIFPPIVALLQALRARRLESQHGSGTGHEMPGFFTNCWHAGELTKVGSTGDTTTIDVERERASVQILSQV